MQRKTDVNFIVRLSLACIIIVLAIALLSIQMKLNELKKSKQAMESQIEDVVDVIDELSIRLNTPVTDDYIERVARDELGYRREGEIIFYNDLAN